MSSLVPEDPIVIALALGALLASLSSIVTSACRDMFDFEMFDLRDNIGDWVHPGRAGTLARRRLRDTSQLIVLLYMTRFVLLLDLQEWRWIPGKLALLELTITADDMVVLLNYLTMLLIGWILWLSATVTVVRTRREHGVSL